MSADLHALVHSLTKSERKQLRMQGTHVDGSPSNYLMLMDAFLEQAIYDEKALAERFTGSKMLGNFAVAKAYLYSSILRTATQLLEPKSVEAALRRSVDEVEYLLNKGFDRLASKALEKALYTARTIDLPAYKSELLRWKRRLVNRNPSKTQAELLEQIKEEELLALEQQLLDAKLRMLRAQAQTIFSENAHARTMETQAQLSAIQSDAAMQAEAAQYSFQAQQTKQAILSICHRMLGKDSQALECLQTALTEWHGRSYLIRTFPDQYLQTLVGFLDACLSSRDFANFLKNTGTLAQFDPVAPKLQARAELLRINLDLRYALLTGDFEFGLKAGSLAHVAMDKHASSADPSIAATMLFNLSSLYFLQGDHAQSLQTINQILNRQASPIRQDIADAARLMEMAIHLDLHNLDLVESLQRAMHRRLRLHPRIEDFENILVRGLKKWWEAMPAQQDAILRETYREIWELEGAGSIIGRQEILLWLRSKIDGISPAILIRKEGLGALTL
ncbi:MAG: hypothetical protein RLZZ519_973 [Bacteroidota bacterium]|jgi:hypothetical protein